jgi:hypothetical protein
VFDVQARDIVRQQHDFIGKQAIVIRVRQHFAGNTLNQVHDEVARPGAGIKDDDFGGRER